MRIHNIQSQISAWIECPLCDGSDESNLEGPITSEPTSPKFEKLHATCDRCGGYAILYLLHVPPQVH
jgi:hypothetical protein